MWQERPRPGTLAQTLAGSVKPGHHGSDGDSQDPCDLGIREVVEVPQHQNLALGDRQQRHGAPEPPPALTQKRVAFRVEHAGRSAPGERSGMVSSSDWWRRSFCRRQKSRVQLRTMAKSQGRTARPS